MQTCERCFDEPMIQEYIQLQGDTGDCDFCQSEEVAVLETRELRPFLLEGVYRAYPPAIEVSPYCSAEGGYLMPTADPEDILAYNLQVFSLDDPTELLQALNLFDEEHVVDLPSDASYDAVEPEDWSAFSRYAKEHRYTAIEKHRDFLGKLWDLMSAHLLEELEPGTTLFRARLGADHPPSGLASPPMRRAAHNRMSPEGVPYFYGADDRETALAEVQPALDQCVTVGQFRLRKALPILDFTRKPAGWSPFSADFRAEAREFVRFARHFQEDISRQIAPEDSSREYLPTQVIVEYLRQAKTRAGDRLEGLAFPSSRKAGGRCLVLFRGEDILSAEEGWLEHQESRVFRTAGVSYRFEPVRRLEP